MMRQLKLTQRRRKTTNSQQILTLHSQNASHGRVNPSRLYKSIKKSMQIDLKFEDSTTRLESLRPLQKASIARILTKKRVSLLYRCRQMRTITNPQRLPLLWQRLLMTMNTLRYHLQLLQSKLQRNQKIKKLHRYL